MNFFTKIKEIIFKYKKTSIVVILVLLGVGYFWYQSSTSAKGVSKYVLAEVVKGTVISSVSGTGQVSALNQIDIKPETSGQLVYLNISKNTQVKAGTLLAQIQSRDAQKAVQSAKNDLATAELSSQDIGGPAGDALKTSYSNALDALTTTFNDLVAMKANLDAMFLESSYHGSDSDINYYIGFVRYYDTNTTNELSYWNTDAKKKYTDMQTKLDALEAGAWKLNTASVPAQIESAVNDSYSATNDFTDLIRQVSNLIQRYQKISSAESLTTPISSTTTTNQTTQLSGALSTLTKDSTALYTAKTDITTRKQAFAKVGVDTQAQNLNILQYQNALADAQNTLAKYFVYAPIDGIISAYDTTVKVGDNVSAGVVLGSIISKQDVVEISLSEVDAVKVKKGQKTTITFDALPDLTATGSVEDIDSVGTTTQGVVSYGVKIALDVNDAQIKPGMSASVNVITNTRQNVLTVPNSAVKSKNGVDYVLVLNQKQDLTSATASQGFVSTVAPTQKTVEIGLADDTNTEITSGLVEGDQVVSRTITATKTTATATSTTTSRTTRQATQSLTGGAPPGGF